jgi:hypothetical protein
MASSGANGNLAFLLRVAMIWDKVAAPEADPLWKL